jgi:S-DNA-T family DNA segregation ATPase FtsK/SpoIIIE
VFELDRRDPRDERGARRRLSVDVDGAVAFNRPPRVPPAAEPPPVEAPADGTEAPATLRLPLVAVVAPLVVAVAATLLADDARFLLIGLLAPVLAAGPWLAGRHQRGGDGSTRTTGDAATAGFRRAVAARRADDERRARSLHPTLADAIQDALRASPTLWQRRPGDPDAFRIPVGLADLPWRPALEHSARALGGAQAIVDEASGLHAVPVVADLAAERGIGIVASRDTAVEMARGVMLAAAAVHGPADLDMVVLTSRDRLDVWEWAKWLPHVRRGDGPAVLSEEEQIRPWADVLRDNHSRPARPGAPEHITLVVVDEPGWWRDRSAPLRRLFGDATLPLRFVALAPAVVDLPAVCTTVISEQDDDHMTVEYVLRRDQIDNVAANLADAPLALEVARALAPLDDPDMPTAADAALPAVVPIFDVLGLVDVSARAILDRWSALGRPPAPRAPVGTAERGNVMIDLVADGPHGVIVGTVGSGKSELLLSVIAGLAAELPPDVINFVLVDVTGGSRFDACAALPHTVSMITDVDEHLAARFVRCLRAELRHREGVLRDAAVASVAEYQRDPRRPPLPRLVVIVDEFASAAVELPDFLPALTDVAQRGASLGVHMIFATRHPPGAVDSTIMSIANLRIALRVQDDADSMDVIGARDAALLSRRLPGRAIARLAGGELVEFQSACSTGATERAGGRRYGLRPFVLGRELTPLERRLERHARRLAATTADGGDALRGSDLVTLVRATSEAARELGQDRQRLPCPEPLPEHLPLSDLLRQHPGDAVPYAMIDVPDEQCQVPAWWEPGPDGTLIAYGATGAGTSSLLATLALGAAQRQAPDDLHIYAIDGDSDLLAPLDRLPHCGAVVRSDEEDRIARLARFLADEIDWRASRAPTFGGPAAVARREPTIVVLIDDVGALRQLFDERRALDGVWELLERVIREGPALGVCAVLTATHERALPAALATRIEHRLVLRLGDQFAYAAFGFRPVDLPEFVPGRALRVADRAELQLAEPPSDLQSAVAEIDEPASDRPPRPIHPLPAEIPVAAIVEAARTSPRGFLAPVGLSMATAAPVHLEVNFGEAAFVAGRPRSGKSSVLVAVAEAVRRTGGATTIFAVGPRGGPLMASDAVDDRPDTPADVAAWVERIASAQGTKLVLVDDADRIGGPSFERLAALRDERCAIVVAGTADELRSSSHWSQPMQRFRGGVLIRPTEQDAELLHLLLGPSSTQFASGTGIVVNDGKVERVLLVSVEHDDPQDGPSEREVDAGAGRTDH